MTIRLTSPLILALPKGRIYDELAPVMKQVGIVPEADFFDEKSRALKFATNIEGLSIIRVRSCYLYRAYDIGDHDSIFLPR